MSNGDGDRCVTSIRATASREGDWGARKSVMMRAIASHQRGPVQIPVLTSYVD